MSKELLNIRCCCNPRFCFGSIEINAGRSQRHVTILTSRVEAIPDTYIPGVGMAAEFKVEKHKLEIGQLCNLDTGVATNDRAIKSNDKPAEYFEKLPGYQPICLLP